MVEAGLWLIFALSLVFAALLVFLLMGLFKKNKKLQPIPTLAIVLAFKNEAHQLPQVIARFQKLLEYNQQLNIILVNDHSTDEFAKTIKQIDRENQIKVFDLPIGLSGKKAAVSYGIEKVSTSWVLVIDADTEIPKELILPNTKILHSTTRCVLVPLHPKREKGILRKFFDLEFLSLHVAGLASANVNLPLLANGACMFICRKAYLKTKEKRTDWNEPSGDDVFTMFAISELYGRDSITVLHGVLACVHFPKGGKKLFNQRLRWVAKTGKIKNGWFQFVSVLVLISQLVVIACLWNIVKYGFSVVAALSLLCVLLAEIVYLTIACFYLQRRDLWVIIPVAILLYPFYLVVLLIFSTFAKPKWK